MARDYINGCLKGLDFKNAIKAMNYLEKKRRVLEKEVGLALPLKATKGSKSVEETALDNENYEKITKVKDVSNNVICHLLALGIKDEEVIVSSILDNYLKCFKDDKEIMEFATPQIEEIIELLNGNRNNLELYYCNLKKNNKACLIKVINSCHNVRFLNSISQEKINSYKIELEKQTIPLTKYLMIECPDFSDEVECMQLQIESVLSTIEALTSISES